MSASSGTDRSLPSGTVTFLFSDIEDSTRLWEAQQGSMNLALARHDAIMRGAVKEHRGHLVKTTGDGMYAVFAIASDAMAACLSAQRALSELAVGDVRLKSRMALHSGNAELRENDYFGPVLNRASRLMAAAHGGQVLLSGAACELVGDGLPAGVTLRDLGERRLKDLIQPERVFQLVTADLVSEFPPLRTLDARPNNLPAQTTAFVGREAEIGAIKAQLRDTNVRLLTLSGPGGTGKTRLAIQAAADLIDAYEHGGFFVALAAITDAALVVQTIAQVFDLRETAGCALKDLIKEHLRAKQLLLVLDNFEQVVDSAPLVAELLAAAPRLNVLVTSRELLRVAGEKDYPLQPLALPDLKRLPPVERLAENEAVALFVERASAVKAGFALGDENAAAIAQICVRLDGLPLAIELAAARVRVLPPQRMLSELSDPLKFLVSGARDVPARQKTLRGAIDWSHDLLTPAEQTLFRRLSVFVGGSTLEAIESICRAPDDPQPLETVESLVGKSLLRQTEIGGEPRFSMLETLREYADQHVRDAGEARWVQERHLTYFLAFAEASNAQLVGPTQGEVLRRLENEYENLRAAMKCALEESEARDALRFCAALQRFWVRRGYLSEGREWCERILAAGRDVRHTALLAWALNARGVLAYCQADYPAARTSHEQSLAIGRELDDRSCIAASLNGLGNVAQYQGDFDAARRLFEESLATKRELGDRRRTASALCNLANVVNAQGDRASARALFEESAEICRAVGDRSSLSMILLNLGEMAHAEGDIATAKRIYGESMSIQRELGDRIMLAGLLLNLGNVAVDERDFLAARALHGEGLAIAREIGDKRLIASALDGLAADAGRDGDTLRAASLWGAAEALRAEIGAAPPPTERVAYERDVAAARSANGDDAGFDRAWGDGNALALDDAIGLALRASPTRC